MTEETKKEEHKHEEEKKPEKRASLFRLGNNKKEVLENISFIIILVSAVIFSIGIGLGSFIQGTISLSIFGSFFIIVGIVIYIASQFIEVK